MFVAARHVAAALRCRIETKPQALVVQLSNAAAMMLLRVQYCSF
jgi:hypothetical protein